MIFVYSSLFRVSHVLFHIEIQVLNFFLNPTGVDFDYSKCEAWQGAWRNPNIMGLVKTLKRFLLKYSYALKGWGHFYGKVIYLDTWHCLKKILNKKISTIIGLLGLSSTFQQQLAGRTENSSSWEVCNLFDVDIRYGYWLIFGKNPDIQD